MQVMGTAGLKLAGLQTVAEEENEKSFFLQRWKVSGLNENKNK